mmetsp:Transcript_9222/g.16612  ORF Transcript_9222/g.16612 Transcript_9222/m.16612 type:complete len:387 (+) Transcript_9222:68-1228(+)
MPAGITALLCGAAMLPSAAQALQLHSGADADLQHPAFMQPPLAGISPGTERPKLIFAQDIDWPPYAYLGVPPESDYQVAGFGHDMALAMGESCGWDVTVVQADWEECWNAGRIGPSLLNGVYHACMTYTHTAGERNRFLEFSHAILMENKPGGILTRLVDGVPVVDGSSDLSGKTVVDVVGWAPTSDTLSIVENKCTKGRFVNFTMVTPEIPPGANPNDVAMAMLRSGKVDAMWVYADQAKNYQCDHLHGITPEWNCSLWAGLGTEYAYIQTGQFGHVYNGTTLAMGRKGSGIKEIVDPCLDEFLKTEGYYSLCAKHGLTDICYPNEFFPSQSTEVATYLKPTDQHGSTCAEGYCECPGVTSASTSLAPGPASSTPLATMSPVGST